ncbi:hypothetical protein Btru_078058 [Bulinus truncatus]|nr:hypothetical protein Btru_078058 [Bulinus truncatus]
MNLVSLTSIHRMSWNNTLRDIVLHHLDIQVPPPWGDMTLREMLIYPSGSSAADLGSMAGLPEDVDREEIIRRLRFLPKDDNFRSSNHYSNIMYTVASHIAERLSQRAWSDLIKVRVFDKQNMVASSFAPEGMDHEDAALPYRYHASGQLEPFMEQAKSLFDLGPSDPVGSIMASAEDVTKWLRYIIHSINTKGDDSGVNHLIQDALETWVATPDASSASTLRSEKDKFIGYGMGWQMSKYRDLTCYKYRGSLYAYSTQIWLFPELQTGIFVSVNGPGSDNTTQALDGIMYHISDTVLRETPWVTKEQLCHSSSFSNDELKHDSAEEQTAPLESRLIHYLAPLSKYIGIYGNGIIGDLIVESNDANVLEMKLGKNLVGHLMPDEHPSRMKFLASKPLLNTAEWSTNKSVEFVSLPEHDSDDEAFHTVRLSVSDMLIYEFIRGTSFKTILQLAEEADEQKLHKHTLYQTSTSTIDSQDVNQLSTQNTYLDPMEGGEYSPSTEISLKETPEQHLHEIADNSTTVAVDNIPQEPTENVHSGNNHYQNNSLHEIIENADPEKQTESHTVDGDHSSETELPGHKDHSDEDGHFDTHQNGEKTEPSYKSGHTKDEDMYELGKHQTENDNSVHHKEHKNIDNSLDDNQSPYNVDKDDSRENDINSNNDIVGHQSHEPYSEEVEEHHKNAQTEHMVKEENRKAKNKNNKSSFQQASVIVTILTFLINLLTFKH